MAEPISSSPFTLPPAVSGRTVVLRPINRDDYLTFFGWRADASELSTLTSSRRIPTYEEFVHEMDNHLRQSVTLLVLDKTEDQPIGFVQAHSLNLEAGWCFTAAYTEREYRGTSQSVEAYVGLFDFLFRSFGFRKIYVEVPEFDLDTMKFITSGGFVEEGRFREHVWFDGRHWDLIRLAVFRDDWAEGRDRVTLLLDVGEKASETLA